MPAPGWSVVAGTWREKKTVERSRLILCKFALHSGKIGGYLPQSYDHIPRATFETEGSLELTILAFPQVYEEEQRDVY